MPAGSCLPALLAAVYAALSGDATLSALVSGVFNNVPENTAAPYVHIANPTEIPMDAMGRFGRECTIQIASISNAKTDLEALTIYSRCVALLDQKALTVSGYSFAFGQFESQSKYDQVVEGTIVRHVVAIFRYKVMS
jgi:hypothetical protein